MNPEDQAAKDIQYMTRALLLAEQGLYSATPNPRVGCVIVQNGMVVGEGAHLKAGGPHAEVHALRQAASNGYDNLNGADVYVTLEPCSHYGRTPPCAEALVQSGVARVIIAMQDPNPQVAGRGLAFLRQNNIAVIVGVMESQARELNVGFISRMTRGRPFVRSKIAASLDGRTALRNGESKWITGTAARLDVQHWRARSCAILTGAGTVLADNPRMTVRLESEGELRQPLRVVIDSQLRISPDALILQSVTQSGKVAPKTIVAYATDPSNKLLQFDVNNVELLQLDSVDGRVCLRSLLEALAARGVNEVLVEAGQALNGALLEQGLVDELLVYYAPVIMGCDAMGMFALPELVSMDQRVKLELLDVLQIGQDLRLRLKPLSKPIANIERG